jgi:hypothetical protein
MLGAAIIEQVGIAESGLHCGLEDIYDHVSIETAKAMRRVMPITRVKMKWNISEVSLNRSFNFAKAT